MKNIFTLMIILLTAHMASAQTVPITAKGIAAGQKALREQNALNPETKALDRQFQLQKLQRDAEEATANVSAEQKAQQYNLGAEILPYAVPYITKITQDCVKTIDMKGSDAAAKYSECSKMAVQKFQSDPTAFIKSLPEAEKQRLEALVKQRVEQSIRKPTQYMEP